MAEEKNEEKKEEKKFLGTAGVQQLITNVRSEISDAEQRAYKYADDLGVNYDAAGTAATKVEELASGQVKTNKEAIGTMASLETTAKTDLVTAINEVRNAVSAGGTAAAITMTEQTTGLGEGVVKAYVLKQGENTVGTINIPKDMVVQSGEVVTDPDGQDEGTYIKLVLANATNDEIYVNVGTLVDIYKVKESAVQVQIAIDSTSREISASIVAGSIGTDELAADAVVTAKIADGNVTKAKLSTEVQTDLSKAHEHSNATQLATYDKTQTELLKAAKDEFAQRIDDLETSLAEGGATANAIAANALDIGDTSNLQTTDKTDLVSAINEVNNKHDNMTQSFDRLVDDLDQVVNDVISLKAVSYVEITADEIDTMFAAE